MNDLLEFTILGCGSSGGVPRADGNWGVCDPAEPRNRRTRCSLLVRRVSEQAETPATTLVVDTSPEFSLQMAGSGARRLDAALFTHDHADQSHGIDDLRVFWGSMRRRIPCHFSRDCMTSLTRRFDYVFEGELGYPAICEAHEIPPHGTPWAVDGPSGAIPILTFDQEHGPIRSVGYRFGDVAYSPDVSDLPPEALPALRGLKLWIVDALRWTPHPTHFTVEKALAWIAELKPERAILTNLHVDLDYRTLAAQLPDHVEPAYDGMRVAVPL
jgi:phosphoribosyl 1,2-cyclic phosphate phosphodiesterase